MPNIISHNHLIADLISIVGTTDFVLGSVDQNTDGKEMLWIM